MPIRAGMTSLLIAGLLVGSPAPAWSQSEARVRVEENFRREPNGVLLARLAVGATLPVIGRDGNWTNVELQGWVWLESLETSEDPAFDLVVSLDGGENLRAAPGGTIVGRLEDGALLRELERNDSWARVGRIGWVWGPSLDDGEGAPTPEGPAAQAPGGFATVGAAGGPILAAPDGDTLAVATPDSDLEIVRREGNWARVRVEGWMWMPGADVSADAPAETASALEPADLTADPDSYNGRVVAWTLQFISLERAEAVRTDFFEGEPFLLARFGGSDGPFVYVAVAPDRLTEVQGLVPLERVSVTARVRTGASALTATPIVELLSLDRSREEP